jgi:hypothetical protein
MAGLEWGLWDLQFHVRFGCLASEIPCDFVAQDSNGISRFKSKYLHPNPDCQNRCSFSAVPSISKKLSRQIPNYFVMAQFYDRLTSPHRRDTYEGDVLDPSVTSRETVQTLKFE